MMLKSMSFLLSNASVLDIRREPEASISALKSSPQWEKHKDFKTGRMNEGFLNFVTEAFSSSDSLKMARPEGAEPPASVSGGQRSIQLSYGRIIFTKLYVSKNPL